MWVYQDIVVVNLEKVQFITINKRTINFVYEDAVTDFDRKQSVGLIQNDEELVEFLNGLDFHHMEGIT